MILERKLQELKQQLDASHSIHILSHIGYEFYAGNKFKLRPEESTPSASIRKDGYIKDFGGDFGGDLIDLLKQYHDMSFEEAVRYIATCLGMEL